ncbi:MAG: NUDIX hydrolase [Caldilineaceae bacterium]
MTSARNALHHFVADLPRQHSAIVEWPAARFEVAAYLHPTPPPDAYITSVRAVVLRRAEVLVIQDPDGHHMMPGGRREAGESYVDTAVREVAEESGWQVRVGPLLGFLHFQRLTPKPPALAYPHADSAQLVYVAYALEYRPERREENGYELGAQFVPLTQLASFALEERQQLFLQAALAAAEQTDQ